MKTIILSSVVVLSLTMGTAIAETNKANRLLERFAKLDTNGNGSLSLDEFKAGKSVRRKRHGRKSEKIFSRLDLNGNGVISLEEWKQKASQYRRGKRRRR